jgi:hypothetical protein
VDQHQLLLVTEVNLRVLPERIQSATQYAFASTPAAITESKVFDEALKPGPGRTPIPGCTERFSAI